MSFANKYIFKKKNGIETEVEIVSRVDTTLTQEDVPGDAKIIGEKIAELNEKIDNIQITGSGEREVINKPTHFDFPSMGSVDFIYKAYNEKKTYQWNAEELRYEPLNEGGAIPEIKIINGGNANGIDY